MSQAVFALPCALSLACCGANTISANAAKVHAMGNQLHSPEAQRHEFAPVGHIANRYEGRMDTLSFGSSHVPKPVLCGLLKLVGMSRPGRGIQDSAPLGVQDSKCVLCLSRPDVLGLPESTHIRYLHGRL